jgi:hypothetical protein
MERNTNATIVMALSSIAKLIEYKKIGTTETNTQLVCLSSEIRSMPISWGIKLMLFPPHTVSMPRITNITATNQGPFQA